MKTCNQNSVTKQRKTGKENNLDDDDFDGELNEIKNGFEIISVAMTSGLCSL